MLALKLKLDPTPEQMQILDKMFWKWASICSRMSRGEVREEFHPPENAEGIWFSKTQLNQAQTDINDLQGALQRSAEQKKREIYGLQKRSDEIRAAVENAAMRDVNPARQSSFRPKSWVDQGKLKARFHTLAHWQGEIKEAEKRIQRKKKTIELIKRGRIRMKPKRITLHQNSFLISFGGKKLILKPFHKADGVQGPLEIQLITEPIQPKVGGEGGTSSQRSTEFLSDGIMNYLAFSIDRLFFGMNRAEEMLLLAKNPEKVAKKEAKLTKKRAAFDEKIKKLEKLLGRSLSTEEKTAISSESSRFFENIDHYLQSPEYSALLLRFAGEVAGRKEVFGLEKYPILIRKPINRYKLKKLSNLDPSEWEYFLQVSYEPAAKPKIETSNVMGIDRGLKHLLAIAIFDPNTGKFTYNKLVENPVDDWKWKLRKIRKSLLHLERRHRAQTGEHLHENQMKKNIKSIENKVENLYHEISRRVVNAAVENRSAIVFESLERQGMKQHARGKGKRLKALNYALSLFDYGKVAGMIKYKADMEGVPVSDILPAYTSQNCAKCLLEGGAIQKEEQYYRRGKHEKGRNGKDFLNTKIGICEKHGQIDADLNAARTIAVCFHKKLNEPLPFGQRNKYRYNAKR